MNMDDLRLSDLKDEYRMVAEVIGLENYMELCRSFGGNLVCIPGHYHLYRNYYTRKILADKGKHSNKELAKLYPVSRSTIYNIQKSADKHVTTDTADKLVIQDLAAPLQDIAELIGFETFLALCKAYESSQLYIPTVKEVTRKYVERKIIENKDIFSKRELTRIYGLSASTIYNILKKKEN